MGPSFIYVNKNKKDGFYITVYYTILYYIILYYLYVKHIATLKLFAFW